jgi:hypothetical protein
MNLLIGMNKPIPERNFLYLTAKSEQQINKIPQEKLFEQKISRNCTPEANMSPFSSLPFFSLFTQTFQLP